MKKLVLMTVISLLSSSIIFAQVAEEKRSMKNGTQNSLTIQLPKTDAKNITKVWYKKVKDLGGKTKKDKKTGFIFSDNAVIKEIGNNTMDIYSVVKSVNNGTELTVWVDLGGAYLNSIAHPKQYAIFQKMMTDFAQVSSKGLAEDKLKVEEKTLSKEEDIMKKLQKEQKDYLKEIEDAKAQIAKAEKGIEVNKEEQNKQQQIVSVQEKIVNEIKKQIKAMK